MVTKFNKNYYLTDNVNEKKRDAEGFIKEYILSLPKKARVLDVGCGSFIMLNKIHKWRPDIKLYGIDIGDVGKPQRFIIYKKSSGDKIKFVNNMFDMVTCFHVLEHVINPHDFISEFNRVSKKGALIYIETPYYKKMNVCDCKMNFWSDPTHIRAHTVTSIKRLLVENNIRPLSIRVFRNWQSIIAAPYLIWKYILKGDKDALGTLQSNIGGNSIGGIGVKK